MRRKLLTNCCRDISRPIEVPGFRTAAQPIACKHGSYALRAESKAWRSGTRRREVSAESKLAYPTPERFCPEGVGVRLADDLPGTGSKT
jgi:hypothetical protein